MFKILIMALATLWLAEIINGNQMEHHELEKRYKRETEDLDSGLLQSLIKNEARVGSDGSLLQQERDSLGSGQGDALKVCYACDNNCKTALGGWSNALNYLRWMTNELDNLLQANDVTLNGQQLRLRQGYIFARGTVSLYNYQVNDVETTELDAINAGLWKYSGLFRVAQTQAYGCDVGFFFTTSSRFSKLGVNGMAGFNTLCSSSAHGVIEIQTSSSRKRKNKEKTLTIFAHEMGHLLGAQHITDLTKITNVFNGTVQSCDGTCDESSGCIMDVLDLSGTLPTKYSQCAKNQIAKAYESIGTSCLGQDVFL